MTEETSEDKARQQDKATVTDGRYSAHVRAVTVAGSGTCDSERRFLLVHTIYDMSTRAWIQAASADRQAPTGERRPASRIRSDTTWPVLQGDTPRAPRGHFPVSGLCDCFGTSVP